MWEERCIMVEVIFTEKFERRFKKSDCSMKIKIRKQIKKIIQSPEIGKPMMYGRKGTRELYIGSFRLSYSYAKEENILTFLNLYHKDEQ